MAQDIYDRVKCLRNSAKKNCLTDEEIKLYRESIEEYSPSIRKQWADHQCLFSIAEVPPKSDSYISFICIDLLRFLNNFASVFMSTKAKRCFCCCDEDINCDEERYSYAITTFELESPLETVPKKFHLSMLDLPSDSKSATLSPNLSNSQESPNLSSSPVSCYSFEDRPDKQSNGKKILERIRAKPLKVPNADTRNIVMFCDSCRADKKIKWPAHLKPKPSSTNDTPLIWKKEL